MKTMSQHNQRDAAIIIFNALLLCYNLSVACITMSANEPLQLLFSLQSQEESVVNETTVLVQPDSEAQVFANLKLDFRFEYS
jgi:hypothetical protein